MLLSVCLRGCLCGAFFGLFLLDKAHKKFESYNNTRHYNYVKHHKYNTIGIKIGVKEGRIGLCTAEQIAYEVHHGRIEEYTKRSAYDAQNAYADIYLVIREQQYQQRGYAGKGKAEHCDGSYLMRGSKL